MSKCSSGGSVRICEGGILPRMCCRMMGLLHRGIPMLFFEVGTPSLGRTVVCSGNGLYKWTTSLTPTLSHRARVGVIGYEREQGHPDGSERPCSATLLVPDG